MISFDPGIKAISLNTFSIKWNNKRHNLEVIIKRKTKETIFKTSNLFTQDKFVLDGTEEGLYDMEGASFYQTAHIFNKPIVAIKVVSDLIGKNNQITNYNEFENKSSYLIKEIVLKIL